MTLSMNRAGFSLVELIIALTIALGVTATVCVMVNPASGAFQMLPESADERQRSWTSVDALAGDLLAAGTLPVVTLAAASRPAAPPAVFPMRIGRRAADAVGTFSATRFTAWYVKRSGAQTTLALPLTSASGSATIALGPSCPPGDAACGFEAGMTVAVLDRNGNFDLFSITGVQGPVLTLQHNLRDTTTTYAAGDAVIAEAVVHTYQFRNDPATGVGQLIRYDSTGAADAPVVDHIVSFGVEYAGDPQPPLIVPGASSWEPPHSTYGPLPPAPTQRPTAYPVGENCAFARDTAGAPLARLPALVSGPALVALAGSLFTDGPWCPDAASANRYDADLLRVRSVVITIRVEAAIAALRGPAGPLFTRAGTARGSRFVPDTETRLQVSPRGTGE
jgi:prepilin-type N-terminal cleavage/methylation domain-containing protein